MSKLEQVSSSDGVWSHRLFHQVDNAILVLVRIVIGISIYFWACYYTKIIDYGEQRVPLYQAIFYAPQFLFKYSWFEWVRLWPHDLANGIDGMYWQFLATKIAGILLAIGLLTRLSAAVLCASIAYVLLVERQIYLNHYYLLSCAAGLLVFLPAARRWSVDEFIGIERSESTCARWQIWLVRFQLGMPYVFGAVAKMNYDWLRGQPGAMFLEAKAHIGFVKSFLEMPFAVEIFSYGGLLYDLMVVPMLLWNKWTRWLAVIGSILFHVSNSQLFNIGVFPWFMLATLVVFFPIDTITNIARCVRANFTEQRLTYADSQEISQANAQAILGKLVLPTSLFAKVGFGLAVAYVVVQLLLPVRPWVLPGEPSWNERGQRFSWRMMLRRKRCLATYLVKTKDEAIFFPSTTVMTPYQASRAERNPELLRQAAFQFVRNGQKVGVEVTEVYCLALVSMNGRRPAPMIDPDVNLLEAKRGWLVDDWVKQDFPGFRRKAWMHPKEDWWIQVTLPDRFKELLWRYRRPSELEKFVQRLAESTHGKQPAKIPGS